MKNTLKQTRNLVIAALMCALTCISTMIIQIPTPGFGYIHPGDGMVLLSGILLGPVTGALAAGIGSMLADLFTGYVVYAVPTLIIKAATAWIAAVIFRRLNRTRLGQAPRLFLAGIPAEINMAAGYFIYKILLTMLSASSFTQETFHAGLAGALGDIPSSILQGASGVLICVVLFPVLVSLPQFHTEESY